MEATAQETMDMAPVVTGPQLIAMTVLTLSFLAAGVFIAALSGDLSMRPRQQMEPTTLESAHSRDRANARVDNKDFRAGGACVLSVSILGGGPIEMAADLRPSARYQVDSLNVERANVTKSSDKHASRENANSSPVRSSRQQERLRS